MKGKKVRTSPTTYEIEILSTSKPIPKIQEVDFIEWVSTQSSLGCGKHFEYYSYTDNYKDDIGVGLDIRTISNKCTCEKCSGIKPYNYEEN